MRLQFAVMIKLKQLILGNLVAITPLMRSENPYGRVLVKDLNNYLFFNLLKPESKSLIKSETSSRPI